MKKTLCIAALIVAAITIKIALIWIKLKVTWLLVGL